MGIAQQFEEHFTYDNYCQWPDDERWELIDGIAYAMTAPQRLHQEIAFNLSGQLYVHFQGKTCKPYFSPFDVRLPKSNEADDQVDTVVQPDLLVVCDTSKLDDKGCRGAPDWIIEVLSPSTALKDMDIKRRLYEAHGVKEYWLIHPSERWIMVYLLNDQEQFGQSNMYSMEQALSPSLFPDLQIDWSFMNDA